MAWLYFEMINSFNDYPNPKYPNSLWDLPMIFENDDGDEKAEHVAMDNIWALVQNNEYVLSRVFQPYDIFPGEQSYGLGRWSIT